MCGLKSKLNIPEFCDYVSKFDVFVCLETKLDELDHIELDNYVFFSKPRKQKASRRSGGIGIFVKKSINEYVKIIESDCEYVLWCTVDKCLFNTDDDVLLGAVYIPPDSSRFYTRDLYLQFLNEAEHRLPLSKYNIIMGDFNVVLAHFQDVTEVDNVIFDSIDVNVSDVFNNNTITSLLQYNMSIERRSCDTIVNAAGNNLLDLCMNNDLVILNGRAFTDKDVGHFTCKSASVVDYVLSSTQSLCLFTDFKVDDFCSMLSDVHNPIAFSLKYIIPETPVVKVNDCINTWRSDKLDDFLRNIDVNDINNITSVFDDPVSDDKNAINTSVFMLGNVLTEAAKSTFGTSTIIQNSGGNAKRRNQSWFNHECKSARNKFHLRKRIFVSNKSDFNKSCMLDASKQYKKTISKAVTNYKRYQKRKIRNMRSNSPKQYWNYVNRLSSKTSTSNVDIDMFYDYFKDLNSNENPDSDVPEPDFPNVDLDNELDVEITRDEIIKCIQKLKNGKRSGLDNIANEYIKNTSDMFMPVYVKLFNRILDTGILPDSWLSGSIVPIYKNKGDISLPENYRPITILSCLGKLFTAILNNRLTDYLESNDLSNQNQAGFRKHHSTVDNIFILHILSEYCKIKKSKLFCAFIDFKKAFDSVWRAGLWSKITKYNIDGKLFNIIKNMYSDIKSCVSVNGDVSGFFSM